jgi:hypothetical protein
MLYKALIGEARKQIFNTKAVHFKQIDEGLSRINIT